MNQQDLRQNLAGSMPPCRAADDDAHEFAHVRHGRSKAAVKGVFWSVINSFAPALFGMLVFMVTSRALQRSEFGLVAFAASIATLGTAIAPGGFGEAIIQQHDIGRRHLTAAFWLCLVAAIVIYVPMALSAAPLAAHMNEPGLTTLIPFLGLRVIFDMIAIVPNALLVRQMSFSSMAMRTVVASFIAGAVCVILLLLGFGLWALAFSQLAASIASCVGALFSARWLPDVSFDRKAFRELASFGFFATGYRILNMLSLDQILIGMLVGPGALGIYSFARRIYQILSDLIAGALGSVSYSLLSSLQREPAKLRRVFMFATFTSSVLSFPVFIGMAITADQFIPLAFGAHWAEAVPAVQGFCALGLLSSVGVLQSSLIRSQGQANMWFYYLVAKQALTIFYVLLFYSWGINALVTAVVIQNYLMWLPSVMMCAQILRVPMLNYLMGFAKPALATLFMYFVTTLIKAHIHGLPPLAALGLTIGTGGLAYTAFLTALAWKNMFQMRDLVLRRGMPSGA